MHGWGATSISGDHLDEDEESPLSEQRWLHWLGWTDPAERK